MSQYYKIVCGNVYILIQVHLLVLTIKENQFKALTTPITGLTFATLYILQLRKPIKRIVLSNKLIGR